MIFLNYCIGLIEISVEQVLSLVIPSQVHMVIVTINLDVIPLVILIGIGCRIDACTHCKEGLNSNTLKQVLQSFCITFANSLAVHQRTISIM